MAGTSYVTIKISLILLVVGLIIFVIGFAAPYWVETEFELQPDVLRRNYASGRHYSGLWAACDDYDRWDSNERRGRRQTVDECSAYLGNDIYTISSELRATQFFETIGLIGIVTTFVLLLLGLCVSSLKGQRIIPIIASVCCLASAGSIILGTIIYGSRDGITASLSWAFFLTIVSGIVFIGIGIIILVGAIVNNYEVVPVVH